MGLLRKLFGSQDDWLDFYDVENSYKAFENNIISKALSVEVENNNISKMKFVPTDKEREYCLKLFERAADFNELEAATVMSVLCQTHMDIVLGSIMNEINNLKDKVKNGNCFSTGRNN